MAEMKAERRGSLWSELEKGQRGVAGDLARVGCAYNDGDWIHYFRKYFYLKAVYRPTTKGELTGALAHWRGLREWRRRHRWLQNYGGWLRLVSTIRHFGHKELGGRREGSMFCWDNSRRGCSRKRKQKRAEMSPERRRSSSSEPEKGPKRRRR
ncbi:hypothetical protein BHE74_00017708 [Ensete ventricosum]|nr:hypothetical protein BHE74_00017708 [Ensete ventricosum]